MNIISKYIERLQVEEIAVDIISKIVSLLLLLTVFLIAKRVLNFIFTHAIAKSISLSRQTEARKKTIVKLLHNIMSYTLYFFFISWVLSILGVPVSSLLAGAGLAGVALGLGAQGFLTDVVNGFFILLENQFEVGDSVVIGLSKEIFQALVFVLRKFAVLMEHYILFLTAISPLFLTNHAAICEFRLISQSMLTQTWRKYQTSLKPSTKSNYLLSLKLLVAQQSSVHVQTPLLS